MKILTAHLSVLFASTSFSQTLQNDNGWRPAWGLDRIDQREEALNDTYLFNQCATDGSGERGFAQAA